MSLVWWRYHALVVWDPRLRAKQVFFHTTDCLEGDRLGAAVCLHLNTGGSRRTEYTVCPAHNSLESVAAAGPAVGSGSLDNLPGDRVGWLVVG